MAMVRYQEEQFIPLLSVWPQRLIGLSLNFQLKKPLKKFVPPEHIGLLPLAWILYMTQDGEEQVKLMEKTHTWQVNSSDNQLLVYRKMQIHKKE